MSDGSNVYFKATKENVYVILNDTADFDEIKESLSLKASRSRRFFGAGDAFIIFKGRRLSYEEEAQLVKIIEEKTDLRVFVEDEKNSAQEFIPSEHSAFDPSLHCAITLSFPKEDDSENPKGSVFHKGSLRSGMSIKSKGSVVVIGDVNPGGEIIAGGNIVVLGTLKGLAHAGAYGDKNTFVAALSLQPVQLRIANMITTVAEELDKQGKAASTTPSYAYVTEDHIYIEPLV